MNSPGITGRPPLPANPLTDRSKVDPQVVQAAEGMEAMFLNYMMKVMRETVPKSDLSLESPATEVYRSMLDSETAQIAARTGGVGLADQIIAYLEGQRYNSARVSKDVGTLGVTHAPQPSTGGTDESWTHRK